MPDRVRERPLEAAARPTFRKREGSDLRISCESRLRPIRSRRESSTARHDRCCPRLPSPGAIDLSATSACASPKGVWSCKSRAILRRSVSVSFAQLHSISASAELVLASRLFCRCAHHIATSANVNNIDKRRRGPGKRARATANSKPIGLGRHQIASVSSSLDSITAGPQVLKQQTAVVREPL